METEIKLQLPPGARDAVEAEPELSGSAPRTTRLVSTYYDTPDFALRSRGVVLRIRETGAGHVQAVKGPGAGGGFASRFESETGVASGTIDAEALARHPEARALVGDDLERLAAVFVVAVERTERRIVVESGTEIDVAIDVGEVRAGDRHTPLSELELELRAGPPTPLYRLAAALARRHGLRFGAESKAERGYGLLTAALPPHPGVADLVFDPGVSFADAFARMIAAGARDFAADIAGAARGDVEGVHRLRAAIRKLRSLLVLFGPHLDRAATARFNEELRDLGRVLGQGRDWDVFLAETLTEAEAELGARTLAVLRTRATERARAAHAGVAEVLAGPVPTDLLLGLALWTAGRGWLRDPDGSVADAPLLRLLPSLLDRLAHRVDTRGRRIRAREGEELHDLRKAMKKLRYACDDVASLYRKKRVTAYAGRVKKVLSDLGRINDAAVTRERLPSLVTEGDMASSAAAEALADWNAGRSDRARRELHRHWRRFRDAEPFWD